MSQLYRFGAVAAFLSVVTTIGIHSFIQGPATFEEALLVFRGWPYILSKWWVIIHCLLVIFSMYALMMYLETREKPFARLGFIFFVGFGLFEIARQMLVLTYLFMLRERYLLADTTEMKEVIRFSIDTFSGIGFGLFAAFVLCFMLGNLFFGLSLASLDGKLIRGLGVVLLMWSIASAFGLVNFHVGSESVDAFFEVFNLSFQPVARLYVGVCLWRMSIAT